MKQLPLWIGASALMLIAAMLFLAIVCTVVGSLSYFFVIKPFFKEQQRQELIRREPWRAFE